MCNWKLSYIFKLLKSAKFWFEEFQVSGKAAPEEFVLFREIFTPGKEISRSLGCAPLWMSTRASGSWCSELSLATLGQGVAGAVVSQLFYWQAKKTRVQAVIPSPPTPSPNNNNKLYKYSFSPTHWPQNIGKIGTNPKKLKQLLLRCYYYR